MTNEAPDWYVDHFVRLGHSRAGLNRTWRNLSEGARVSYRRVLTGEADLDPNGFGDHLVSRAKKLARTAHAGQVDKQSRDYFDAHLTPIAEALSLWGPEHEALGWLHDIVEDTDVTLDDLRAAGFSEELVSGVDSMTRRDEPYKALIRRSAADPLGRIGKVVDNAWNILCNADLSVEDPQRAGSMLNNRYLPARLVLLTGSGITAERMHAVDVVLRDHLARLRASTPAPAEGTVEDLRRGLAGVPGNLEVHLRMDSWAYNPWRGEAKQEPHGLYLD